MHDPSVAASYRLLLIEDDVLDQQWVKALLGRIPNFNFELIWAQTYAEGISFLAAQKFDLALVDYAIGPHSGIDFLAAVGGREAGTPLVMLTGNSQYDADIAAMRAGAYDYLDKSKLDEQQLERTLRYVGETRRLELDLRLARDEARAADEAKATFLSNMSHDLRTPLNAIVGFSELLMGEKGFSTDVAEYLKLIHSSGNHLTSMIDDIMLLTQFETSNVDITKARCDLTSLLPNVVSAAHYAATARRVDVRAKLQDQVVLIDADERAVHRMLLNILASACDLTRSGEILTLTLSEDAGGVCIKIEGLCEKLSSIPLMQMTQPFRLPSRNYAADSVYRVGLSLAIAYRIAQLHGAALNINTLKNGNTDFQIVFPCASSNVKVIHAK